ncbi:MAG TPA: carboxypeptidase-like regulatory domain-containing protein, partial [Candidatus Paceibacterota bacterium]|nr:carboxypeptidase-like regulatory domain-containing protein [Candidatus Paceibacterota bacterium]
RSLSYDQVGTVGGIPTGLIAQNATTTMNGIDFPVRTFIQYVDDPADGVGAADTNGITTDYKRIKVSVSYYANGRTQTVDIISNYAPQGLETTTNGGTLKISVVNANGAGVAGASVHIVNASTSPSIDLTTFSDATGVVFLPGAPTSTQYQVAVTKNGYSSAQTYARDTTNQNPTPGYLTVVKGQTTTGTFAIDLVSTLVVNTFLPIATSTFADTFSTGANVTTLSNAVVSGGAVQLSTGSDGYSLSGNAVSVAQAPTYLAQWGVATATTSVPAGTSVRFHIVDGSGTLLPDTALPGNATGFTSSVDLSAVSTSTYPSLALSADLTTSATTTTPLLQDWSISYARGPIPFAGVPFTLTGTKIIGSTGAGVPIYKTTISTSTGATGTRSLSLEWDGYSMALGSYDTVSACNAPPYALSPGATVTSTLMIGSSTTNMVLVNVSDTNGAVSGASVTLSSGGYTKTLPSDSCGSAYFGGLSSGTYSVTATKTGYTTFNATGVTVSGHVFYPVPLE